MLPGPDNNLEKIADIDARLSEFGRRLYAVENTLQAVEPRVTELQTALFGNQKIGMQSIPSQIAEIRMLLILLGAILLVIMFLLVVILFR
jgi:hypothetical protein